MRFFFVATTTLVASVSAAALWRRAPTAPPACSNLCFNTFTNNITRNGCEYSDTACLCRDPVYLQAVINCVASVCPTLEEIDTALQFSAGYCGVAGVNNFPTTMTTPAPGTPTQTPAGGNPPLSHAQSTTTAAPSSTQSQGAASSLKAPVMGVAALVLAAAGLNL